MIILSDCAYHLKIPDPGFGIRDPGSGIRKNLFRILDPGPGVKKAPAPGSGSATLVATHCLYPNKCTVKIWYGRHNCTLCGEWSTAEVMNVWSFVQK
jgi:hypothetical protein